MKKLLFILVPLNIFAQVGPTGIGNPNGGYPSIIGVSPTVNYSGLLTGISITNGQQLSNYVFTQQSGDIINLSGTLSVYKTLYLTNITVNGWGSLILNYATNANVASVPSCISPASCVLNGLTISNVATGFTQAGIGNDDRLSDPGCGNTVIRSCSIFGDTDCYFFNSTNWSGIGTISNCSPLIIDDPGTQTHWDFLVSQHGANVHAKNCTFLGTNGSISSLAILRGFAASDSTNFVENCSFYFHFGASNSETCYNILNSASSNWVSHCVFYLFNDGQGGTNESAFGGAAGGQLFATACVVYGDNPTNGCQYGFNGGARVRANDCFVFSGQTNQQVNMGGPSGRFAFSGGNIQNALIVNVASKNSYSGGDIGVATSMPYSTWSSNISGMQVNLPTNGWPPVYPTNSVLGTNQWFQVSSNGGGTLDNGGVWWGHWGADSNPVYKAHQP